MLGDLSLDKAVPENVPDFDTEKGEMQADSNKNFFYFSTLLMFVLEWSKTLR